MGASAPRFVAGGRNNNPEKLSQPSFLLQDPAKGGWTPEDIAPAPDEDDDDTATVASESGDEGAADGDGDAADSASAAPDTERRRTGGAASKLAAPPRTSMVCTRERARKLQEAKANAIKRDRDGLFSPILCDGASTRAWFTRKTPFGLADGRAVGNARISQSGAPSEASDGDSVLGAQHRLRRVGGSGPWSARAPWQACITHPCKLLGVEQ